MTYRVIKVIKGIPYIYEQESYRKDGKVRTRCRYLGRADSPTHQVNTTSLSISEIDHLPESSAKIEVHKLVMSDMFVRFLAGQSGVNIFPVAILPARARETIGISTKVVFLSQETLQKQQTKHSDIETKHYQTLQGLLDKGDIVHDREKHIIVYFHDLCWWTAVIKGTRNGEAYLQSYHRSNAEHVQRIKKRGAAKPPSC